MTILPTLLPPRLVPPLLLSALGLLTGYLAAGLGRAAPPRPTDGVVRAWVADRSGGRVVGLDQELLVAAEVVLPWPVAVAPRTGGGAWVVSAEEGRPLGPHALRRIDASAAVEGPPAVLGMLVDLADLDGHDALLLDRAADPQAAPTIRLLRASAGVAPRLLAQVDGGRCLAARGDEVLVATGDGRALLFDAVTGAPRGEAAVGGVALDAARGPGGDGWWVLDGTQGGRLLRLADDLELQWEQLVLNQPTRIGAHPREERVWLASATEPHALRVGPGGAIELVLPALPLAGVEASLCLDDGGALFAAPGAVLRYDGAGAAQPGQGGFAFLVDVTRAATP